MTHAGLPIEELMPQAAYVDVMWRICKVLLEEDEQWDFAEAIQLAEGAWTSDSRGDEGMSRCMFNDALFE